MKTFVGNFPKADALLLQELFNGDWSVRSEIQDYCVGCCASTEETLRRILQDGVRLIAGAAPQKFPRHQWTGSDVAVDWYGRLQCLHGIAATYAME